MVDARIEVIFIRHPQSQYNLEGRIQGQKDVFIQPGYDNKLYDVLESLLNGRPIDAVLASDLFRANDPGQKAWEWIRNNQGYDHPVAYHATPQIREIARGRLEGLYYQVLKPGQAFVNPEGQEMTVPKDQSQIIILPQGRGHLPEGQFIVLPGDTKILPPGQTLDHYLYSLDNPEFGETMADRKARIRSFVREYINNPYEGKGGRIIVFSHAHFINHSANYLASGDIIGQPFEPLDNLGVLRLVKVQGERYRRYTPGNPISTPVIASV